MRNVLCVWALWALIGLNYPNQPHLGPPMPHPWLQELYLSSAPGFVSWFDLCSWSVCLQLCQGFVWLWLLVIWLWPCFPCLVLDLPHCHGPAWQSQDVWPWLPSPELILNLTAQLNLITRGPGVAPRLELVVTPGVPAYLAQVLQDRAVAARVTAPPALLFEIASPAISNTWNLNKCSSGCFTVCFLFLYSGEVKRVAMLVLSSSLLAQI